MSSTETSPLLQRDPAPQPALSLLQIHPPLNTTAETDVDIIAIHGLDTKSPDTWIWKPENVNWLADENMLPSRVGQARIFTCDWPAELFEQSNLIQKTIEELARILLEGIVGRPLPNKAYPRGKDKPVVFIASCLGGIILIKALTMASSDSLSLRRVTRAIIFLATPFGGTSFQDVANWAEPGLGFWAWAQGRKVNRLLQSVKGPSFDIDELVNIFTTQCRKDQLDQVMTFYEMGKSNLWHKVFPCIPVASKQLVDKRSATLQMVENPLPLDRPHRIMNKFQSPQDPEYGKVVRQLEKFIQSIREQNLLQQADAWIRKECYHEDKLKIERLSGEVLPMDQCYINLAIIEKLDQGVGQSNDRDKSLSRFSLFARQKVNASDKKAQVNLATIFNERRGGDDQKMNPRRVLIRGRAGVGKTTLCKKIVHEFTRGTWDEWSNIFDRVLWVPLRNLKLQERRLVPGYNFEYLFQHEYFSQSDSRLGLARELSDAMKIDSGRTLFLLDGLDEVSEILSSRDDMSKFLKYLVDRPNVIITSRPNANLPAVQNLHLELETIGFYPDQVGNYLEMAFADQIKKSHVQSFLQEHWLLQGLVRIPIQLDALCYTWDETKPELVLNNLTSIYELIELKLWKKDAVRLGRVTEDFAKSALPREIMDQVTSERDLPEGLALNGLYGDVIEFTTTHLSQITRGLPAPHVGEQPVHTRLRQVSFLRPSDPSSSIEHQTYHFIHLTFQEYFAARYFVRHWQAPRGDLGDLKLLAFGSNETETKPCTPAEFLRKHKYTARYDVFWRFVAGLLDAAGQAGRFIDLIEEQPLDLLGPTHQRLVMQSLSEIRSDLPIREDLEAMLLEWLLFEIDLTGSSLLARASECPEKLLLKALETGSDIQRAQVLRALQYRGTHLSDVAIECLVILLQDKEGDVRYAAAGALGRQLKLSDAAIEDLVILLQDKEGDVRSAAAGALGGQPKLPDAAIEGLVILLQDKEGNVRYAAAGALGRQLKLSDAAIEDLVILLQDKEGDVRSAAAGALGGQLKLPDAAIEGLVILLQDKEGDVRSAAAVALGGQLNLSDAAIEGLVILLQDKEGDVQSAAAVALGRQLKLSGAAIEGVVILLQDKEGDVRSAAAGALGGQPKLPDAAIEGLVILLQEKGWRVRSAAAKALGRQPKLSEVAIEQLSMVLQNDEWDVRSNASKTLADQSNLFDRTLEATGLCLESRILAKPIHSKFFNLRLLEYLYGSLLCRSFEEQLSLYVDDGGRRTVKLNRPSGLRATFIEEVKLGDQLYNTISNGRLSWNIHGYRLWDDFEGQNAAQ